MLPTVADARTWRAVKGLYMGSGVLFLVTIALGIVQAAFQDAITHAQILAHFHAGTIGWVTLSVIATALWVFTGNRPVNDRHGAFAQVLAWVGVVVVAGYIAAFGLAFSGNGPYWLLPLFGVPAWLVIVAAFVFTAVQLRHQAAVTTVHLLLFGALLVASLGATMGVLWGLTYSTSIDPFAASGNGIGAHAAPMDMYLALAFAGIVELLLRDRDDRRWSRWGMTQMVLGAAAAVAASGSQFLGIDQLAPPGLLLFLASFVIYFARIGWRTLTVDLKMGGRRPALFFGGLFFPLYIVGFVYLVFTYFIPGEPVPNALEVAFGHITFVGVGTNLVLAVQSAYADGSSWWRQAEPWGLWILNIGLVLFVAGEFMAERREGALVMAVGVLLALVTVWARLYRARPAQASPPMP